MQKSIWQNPTSISNENSLQTRNRKELYQPDICICKKKKKSTANIILNGKRPDALS